jgi:hypothetical protein
MNIYLDIGSVYDPSLVSYVSRAYMSSSTRDLESAFSPELMIKADFAEDIRHRRH